MSTRGREGCLWCGGINEGVLQGCGDALGAGSIGRGGGGADLGVPDLVFAVVDGHGESGCAVDLQRVGVARRETTR